MGNAGLSVSFATRLLTLLALVACHSDNVDSDREHVDDTKQRS
jgi:hypothetical protein